MNIYIVNNEDTRTKSKDFVDLPLLLTLNIFNSLTPSFIVKMNRDLFTLTRFTLSEKWPEQEVITFLLLF